MPSNISRLSELNHSLDVVPGCEDTDLPEIEIDASDYETYLMAYTLLPLHEYARFVKIALRGRPRILSGRAGEGVLVFVLDYSTDDRLMPGTLTPAADENNVVK